MGSPFPPRKIEKACAVHCHQSEKKYSKEYLSEKTERQRSFGVNGYSFKSVCRDHFIMCLGDIIKLS